MNRFQALHNAGIKVPGGGVLVRILNTDRKICVMWPPEDLKCYAKVKSAIKAAGGGAAVSTCPTQVAVGGLGKVLTPPDLRW